MLELQQPEDRGLSLPNRGDETLNHVNGNGRRGPTEMDIRGSGFVADIFNKASYVREYPHLIREGKVIVAKANLWTPEVTEARFASIVSLSDPEHTSWIGFRRRGAPEGEYAGFNWQTEISIPIHGGSMRLLWMLLRAYEPEAQGHHLGRIGMRLSLVAHPEATDVGHRSGSDAAILSWLMAGICREGTRAPYDIPFNKVPKYVIALPVVYQLTNLGGESPDPATGVSKNEFTEPNRAYVPRPGHRGTERIREWRMKPVEEGGLGMGLRDALFEFCELR